VVIVAIHFAKVIGDKRRFHWADQRISYAQSQLGKVTGLNVISNWNNNCTGTTEQLFNSSVECATSINAAYSVTSNAQASNAEGAISKLMNSPQVFGSAFDNQATQADFNIPSKGLNCDWSFA